MNLVRPLRVSFLLFVAGGACGGSLLEETGAATTNDDIDFGPGGGEVCGNGFDDNGDGLVDENCTCDIGTTAQCYAGPPGAAGVGACKFGTHTCIAGASNEIETLGQWGPCEGSVLPVTELCGDGLDGDCNGRTECDECDSGGVCPPPSSGSGDYNTSGTGTPGSGSGDENTSGAGASGSGSGDENTSGAGAGSGSGDENTSGAGASGSGSGDENTSGSGAAGVGSGSGDFNTSGAGAGFTGSGSGDFDTSGAGAGFTGSGSGDFDTSGAGASSGSGDLNTSGAGAAGSGSSGSGDFNSSGAGASGSSGSGGGDECICKPGTIRWCDTPVGCLWGKQVCAPDGSWGSCIEASSKPANCADLEFYDPGCCLLASNACCQNPYTDESMGDCAQQLDCF